MQMTGDIGRRPALPPSSSAEQASADDSPPGQSDTAAAAKMKLVGMETGDAAPVRVAGSAASDLPDDDDGSEASAVATSTGEDTTSADDSTTDVPDGVCAHAFDEH